MFVGEYVTAIRFENMVKEMILKASLYNWFQNSNQTFIGAKNISNNTGHSSGQQMIFSGNNVYVVWEDDTNGGDLDIFFRVRYKQRSDIQSCYKP